MLCQGFEAFCQLVIDNVVVKGELFTFFDLFCSIIDSLLDNLRSLGASLLQSFLQCLDARSVDEYEIAFDIVFVDLLSSLNINVEYADLYEIVSTFPLFIISVSFPL